MTFADYSTEVHGATNCGTLGTEIQRRRRIQCEIQKDEAQRDLGAQSLLVAILFFLLCLKAILESLKLWGRKEKKTKRRINTSHDWFSKSYCVHLSYHCSVAKLMANIFEGMHYPNQARQWQFTNAKGQSQPKESSSNNRLGQSTVDPLFDDNWLHHILLAISVSVIRHNESVPNTQLEWFHPKLASCLWSGPRCVTSIIAPMKWYKL